MPNLSRVPACSLVCRLERVLMETDKIDLGLTKLCCRKVDGGCGLSGAARRREWSYLIQGGSMRAAW
jgi:hypothetical protein